VVSRKLLAEYLTNVEAFYEDQTFSP